jgi:hypothetical protein
VTLSKIQNNKQATVEFVKGEQAQQLQEIGFVPGARVTVIARAPFNGPIAVRVNCSTFALRIDEAEQINIHNHENISTAKRK